MSLASLQVGATISSRVCLQPELVRYVPYPQEATVHRWDQGGNLQVQPLLSLMVAQKVEWMETQLAIVALGVSHDKTRP